MGASERGHLVRVRLHRTALLWMGLPSYIYSITLGGTDEK